MYEKGLKRDGGDKSVDRFSARFIDGARTSAEEGNPFDYPGDELSVIARHFCMRPSRDPETHIVMWRRDSSNASARPSRPADTIPNTGAPRAIGVGAAIIARDLYAMIRQRIHECESRPDERPRGR